MTQKEYVKKLLIASLLLISLGGWLLHLRIHPADERMANWVPFLLGILSVFVIPIMFYFNKTAGYAYVINGMTVIIGTIMMADFSWHHHPSPVTICGLLLQTTLADIIILWTKFAVGKAIFESAFINSPDQPKRSGRYLRYPNTGWWLVHFAGLTIIYVLGRLLWR